MSLPDQINKSTPYYLNPKEKKVEDGQLVYYKEHLVFHREDPFFLKSYATCLLRGGLFKESLIFFHKSVAVNSNQYDAWCNMAVAYQSCHEYSQALLCYNRSIELAPNIFDTLINKGVCLYQMGFYLEARECLEEVIQRNNDCRSAHFNLGLVLHKIEENHLALASLEKALSLGYNPKDIYIERYKVFLAIKDASSAYKEVKMGLKIDPFNEQLLFGLGNIFFFQNNFLKAVESYQKLIRINPVHKDAWCNLAGAYHSLGQYAKAVSTYDQALLLDDTMVDCLCSQAVSYHALAEYENAINSCSKAISIQENYIDAYFNKAHSLQALFRFNEAIAEYKKVLQIDPFHNKARFNLGWIFLYLENFSEGWPLYESRLSLSLNTNKHFTQPPFDIQAQKGARILVYAEQGFGDVIHFSRYAKVLLEQGFDVILLVPSVLVSIMHSLDTNIRVVCLQDPIPDFAYHCSLLSLPFILEAKEDKIPCSTQYLHVGTDRIQFFGYLLGKKKRFRVGLVVSGSSIFSKDAHRSIPLSTISSLLSLPIDFFLLQTEVKAEDKAHAKKWENLFLMEENLHCFSDTAAAIMNMDLVISVDTAVAHLSGALGQPVWILLPLHPDFRWFHHRKDSPWYASARLFRQKGLDDWSEVVAEIKWALLEAFMLFQSSQ